jgi:hypothetical protein
MMSQASGSSGPTPWQASSGASRSDQLASAGVIVIILTIEIIFGMLISFSNEYDYTSIGFGGGLPSYSTRKIPK